MNCRPSERRDSVLHTGEADSTEWWIGKARAAHAPARRVVSCGPSRSIYTSVSLIAANDTIRPTMSSERVSRGSERAEKRFSTVETCTVNTKDDDDDVGDDANVS